MPTTHGPRLCECVELEECVLLLLLWNLFFVCFFISCTFTYTHMHTCTHAHIHIHTCTHAHIHIHTHAHMHTCTHIHTCTHSHPHTQYGSEGDGYSQKSPHTKREKFEGLNILDAAKVPTLHCKIAVYIALFLLQTIKTRERRMRMWQAEYLFENPFLFCS